MAAAPSKASVEQLRSELGARFQRPMTFFLRRIKDWSLAEDLIRNTPPAGDWNDVA